MTQYNKNVTNEAGACACACLIGDIFVVLGFRVKEGAKLRALLCYCSSTNTQLSPSFTQKLGIYNEMMHQMFHSQGKQTFRCSICVLLWRFFASCDTRYFIAGLNPFSLCPPPSSRQVLPPPQRMFVRPVNGSTFKFQATLWTPLVRSPLSVPPFPLLILPFISCVDKGILLASNCVIFSKFQSTSDFEIQHRLNASGSSGSHLLP